MDVQRLARYLAEANRDEGVPDDSGLDGTEKSGGPGADFASEPEDDDRRDDSDAEVADDTEQSEEDGDGEGHVPDRRPELGLEYVEVLGHHLHLLLLNLLDLLVVAALFGPLAAFFEFVHLLFVPLLMSMFIRLSWTSARVLNAVRDVRN